MKRIYAATAVVAYCSIVYELLLAQSLSIALGHSVKRYSLTIGMYLFALGVGAFLVEFLKLKKTLRFLLRLEIVLAIVGGLVPFLIFGFDSVAQRIAAHTSVEYLSPVLQIPNWVLAHGLVLVIGILSGMELPYLMDLATSASNSPRAAQKVLAFDYLFTCLGAMTFPFFIFRELGIVAGAIFTSALNASAVLLLGFQPRYRLEILVAFALIATAIFALSNTGQINQFVSRELILGGF